MANTHLIEFQEMERSVRWFRGMSRQQISACNNLLYALRDDIEQESTYRVRACITLLGLKPMITANQIKTIMGISQGNDLAFLWFVWEAFYKTTHSCIDNDDKYTANEQLILSAIAHLDMPSTMRALDQILPKAEHSKKYQDMQRAKEQQLARKQQKIQLAKSQLRPVSVHNGLPYLVPQLQPKQFIPMSLTATPNDRKVVFPSYDKYRDKMYRIPNESSRWFTTYEMSPVKREVKRCLSKALCRVFAHSRMAADKSLCNIHRMLEHSSAKKQQELTYETLQRCMKLLDVEGSQKLMRRKRIIRQLEHEVEAAADKLKQYKQRQLSQLRTIRFGACSASKGCQMCTKLASTPAHFGGEGDGPARKDFTLLLNEDFKIPGHPLPDDTDKPVTVLELGFEHLVKKIHVGEDVSPKVYIEHRKGRNAHCDTKDSVKKEICIDKNCEPREGLIKVLNSKGEIAKTIRASDITACTPPRTSSDESIYKYCSRKTMKNGVLQWDYFKIFEPPSQSQSDVQMHDMKPLIRSYCIAALNLAMQTSNANKADKGDKEVRRSVKPMLGLNSQSALDAAGKCAVKMFTDGAMTARGIIDDIAEESNICTALKHERLSNITSIDPEDTQMMMKLLKLAVDVMKRNPHYVLVTLPNANKLPVLLDWVAERYGKTYNDSQMTALAKSSRIVYEHLSKRFLNNINFPYPRVKDFVGDHSSIESYAKHGCFVCKVKRMRDNYHDRLNKMALEESRLIWLALRGYSNLAGSFADTYFAYMPANELDFMRHNLWKSSDFRNVAYSRSDRKKSIWKYE